MSVVRVSGPARIVVCDREVRALVAVSHLSKRSLREVRDIPVVTERSCGWNVVLMPRLQATQPGVSSTFTTEKAQMLALRIWRHFCRYPAWLSLSLHNFPKAD